MGMFNMISRVFLLSVLAVGPSLQATTNTVACSKNTVEQINRNISSCSLITADCLAAFNVKGLSKECLENLKDETLTNLKPKTAGEIMQMSASQIPNKDKFIKSLVKKNNWEENPSEDFVKSFASSIAHMEKLFMVFKDKPNMLAKFLTNYTLEKMSDKICAKIDSESLMKALEDNALSSISGECLKAISPKAFAGLNENKFSQINASALKSMTAEQAESIPDTAVAKMTVEQANSIGTKPEVPSESGIGDERVMTAQARREYLDKHPCRVAGRWKYNVKIEVNRALTTHCITVWSGASARVSTPSMGTVGALCAAFTFFYLFV